MSDNSPVIEFIRDGIRYRIEGGRVRVRRGWVWWDLAVYLKRFGEPEKADNVVEFRRVKP